MAPERTRTFLNQRRAVLVFFLILEIIISVEVASTVVEKSVLWNPLPVMFWHGNNVNEQFVKQNAVKENEDLTATVKEFLAGKLTKSSQAPQVTVGFVHDTLTPDSISLVLGGYERNIELGNKPYSEINLNMQSFLYKFNEDYVEREAKSSSLVNRIKKNTETTQAEVLTVSFQNALNFFEKKLEGVVAQKSAQQLLVLVDLHGHNINSLKDFYGIALKKLETSTSGKYSAFIVGQPSVARSSESILGTTLGTSAYSFLETSALNELTSSLPKKPVVSMIPTSPEILSGTLLGLFVVWMLWIAVGCMTAIPSAQKMFQQPPGPKEGDPQYANTPFEGKRYYPYKNIPMKEF